MSEGRRSFITPDAPAFWVFVAMLALGVLLTAGEQEWFRRISPSGWALSWVLILVYAAPVFLLLFLLDRFEGQPLSMVFAALAWGGLVAAGLAGLANEGWGLVIERVGGPDFASRWTAALTAPLAEEVLKLCGVALLLLIVTRVDDVMDGFIYGAMVGLGFAIVEDVFYFMSVFGGTTRGILVGFFVRVISSGVYGHVLYSGVAGLGLAYAMKHTEFSWGRRLGVAGGLFGLAVGAHFLWNSPLLTNVVRVGPLIGFVAIAIALARRRQRRWLRAAADTAACRGLLSPEDVADLSAWGGRRRARKRIGLRAGPQAPPLLGRLQSAQLDLAMLRARAGVDDDPAVERQRGLVRSLRDALWAIPGAAPARATHPSAAR